MAISGTYKPQPTTHWMILTSKSCGEENFCTRPERQLGPNKHL